MSFWQAAGRIFLQVVCLLLVSLLFGGGIVFVVALFFALPLIALSILILTPLECLAVNFRMRWISLLASPFLAAGVPWVRNFGPGDMTNFLHSINGVCWIFFSWGLAWTMSYLVVWFFGPSDPDPRLLG